MIIKQRLIFLTFSYFAMCCNVIGQTTDIFSYNIDFNWGDKDGNYILNSKEAILAGKPINYFSKPGLWADSNPHDHLKWYKDLGVNVIHSFAVSTNGYAWYNSQLVPPQPGLEFDFMTDLVELGHKEGLKVMGYFCIGANSRWCNENPDLCYDNRGTQIPFTDEYLDFLSLSIKDALVHTKMDGFMIDWVWEPSRDGNNGKWIEAEKNLYHELTGELFPGENNLTEEQRISYMRLSIDRCWRSIRHATTEVDEQAIIWLVSHRITHPYLSNSQMFREVDWLMNEMGSVDDILKIKDMIGDHTQLINCLSAGGIQDRNPNSVIEETIRQGMGLYGFTKPTNGNLLPSMEFYRNTPQDSLSGDDLIISALHNYYKKQD